MVLISDSPSDTSPVQLIKSYLSRLQIPDDCNKFIFRSLVKSKSSHGLIAIDRHISYSTFREHLKSDLFGIFDDPSKLGSHIPCGLVVLLEQQAQVLKNVSFRDMDDGDRSLRKIY